MVHLPNMYSLYPSSIVQYVRRVSSEDTSVVIFYCTISTPIRPTSGSGGSSIGCWGKNNFFGWGLAFPVHKLCSFWISRLSQKPVMPAKVAHVLLPAWCMWWLLSRWHTVCAAGPGICIIVLGQPCQHGVQPQRQPCTNMAVFVPQDHIILHADNGTCCDSLCPE